MYTRFRFKTDAVDFRPVMFPPPGPYWCTGASEEHSIIVAFLPQGEPLKTWWPDATEVEEEPAEVIFFTDRMPCPDWWAPQPLDQVFPTTMDGIKRLAKRIGREQGMKHSKALEAASVRAGFTSFHDARTKLLGAGDVGHS